MSGSNNSQMLDNFLNAAYLVGPALFSGIIAIVFKPFDDIVKIDRRRKYLLVTLRLQMSVEIAKRLPAKDPGMKGDDYIAICKKQINEYFSTATDIVVDLISSENKYKTLINILRFFKYGIVGIPALVLLAGAICMIYKPTYLSAINCIWGIVISIAILIVLWAATEWNKDRYYDLCNKYEVVGED